MKRYLSGLYQATFFLPLKPFQMPDVFIYNGKFVSNGTPVISPDNFGFRYGDGLFETMLAHHKTIRLRDYHFDRLFKGMSLLGFSWPSHFNPAFLESEIMHLIGQYPQREYNRIRLTIFRREAGVEEASVPDYIIQCFEIGEEYRGLNKKGLTLGICTSEFRKNNDALANLKSNNFLPYILASGYGKGRGWDDCLLLNPHERIADSTIANIFMIKDNTIFTPSLQEGPVAGTMRRHLLMQLPTLGFTVVEKGISREEMLSADELFLTNALFGLRWVGTFEDRVYEAKQVSFIYSKIFPLRD